MDTTTKQMNINNINDWMNELAEAIREGDYNKVSMLDDISYQWMQTSEERGAQSNLIEALYEVIE
jgi:hypothetical protein